MAGFAPQLASKHAGVRAGSVPLRSNPYDEWPVDWWVCPVTGLQVPKTVPANLQYRKMVRDRCGDDDGFRSAVMAACSQSCIYWLNVFAWTLRLRKVVDGKTVNVTGNEAHYPLITWPVQDEVIGAVIDAIDEGHDLNIDKSRDMGASWLVLYVFDWRFIFCRENHLGVVSRKESLVDARGDMDSLFEKVRYINRMLPPWMAPRCPDRHMYLGNLDNGSTIVGESTNEDVGRGGRRTAYLIDEAAAIRNGAEVESSLSQTTSCQLWVSTPKGPGTQFYRRIREGRGRYVSLPWWRHPEKAQQSKQVLDELGRVKWTSPWYEELPDRMSRKAIAQEVDMDHGQAGDVFFEPAEIERHRMDHEKPPKFCGRLLTVGGMEMTELEQIEVVRTLQHESLAFSPQRSEGEWRFWVELEDGRPPQHASYSFGMDVAAGTGGSNSVLTVVDAQRGMVVAKWWSAYISPEKFAMLASLAGIWFGGHGGCAFLVWENNGPGATLGRKMMQIGYPRFYRQKVMGSTDANRTNKYGWHNNREKKEILLGSYRDAMASNRLIQPCQQSLDEALDYIYTDTGELLPAELREEPSGGRELHGDHVIADALAWLGVEDIPSASRATAPAPRGSFAHRRLMFRHDNTRREQQAWRR